MCGFFVFLYSYQIDKPNNLVFDMMIDSRTTFLKFLFGCLFEVKSKKRVKIGSQ